MNNLILLLLVFQWYVQDVFCNDKLFSTFYQNGYKLRDVRTELKSYDKNSFNIFEIKTFKYNRTTPAINMTMNMKFDMKDKAEIVVQAFKLYSNQYKYFPVRFQINIKKAVDANIIGLRKGNKCGNMTFYFYKDITYHLCNFVIDETQLPPLMPAGKYKTEGTILYLNKEIAVASIFDEIYVPIVYPKK